MLPPVYVKGYSPHRMIQTLSYLNVTLYGGQKKYGATFESKACPNNVGLYIKIDITKVADSVEHGPHLVLRRVKPMTYKIYT